MAEEMESMRHATQAQVQQMAEKLRKSGFYRSNAIFYFNLAYRRRHETINSGRLNFAPSVPAALEKMTYFNELLNKLETIQFVEFENVNFLYSEKKL